MPFDFSSLGKIADLANKYAPAINAGIGAVGLYQAYQANKDNKKAMKRQSAMANEAKMQADKELAFSQKRLGYRQNSKRGAGAFGLYSDWHSRKSQTKTRYE